MRWGPVLNPRAGCGTVPRPMAKKTSSKSKRPKPESLTFEQAVAELEQIIEQIEEGEIGLEASLAEKRRGDALIKRCRDILDHAEQELQEVSTEDMAGEEADDRQAMPADDGS